MSVKPRPEILEIAAYVGGASDAPGANRVVKLSSNEGAFGTPPGAQAAFTQLAEKLHRYPDGSCTALRAAIGRRFGLDPAHIVCGAGSDDLIYMLAQCYGGPGTELIMTEHGFSIYAIAGRYAGSTVIKTRERHLTADVDAMLSAVSPATRIVFLANPNNPTGSLLPASEVERLRHGLPDDVLLVLDAAYAEYVDRPDYDPGAKLVAAGDNTVMTRTFSKIFGLGAMRVGWCYAPPAVIDVLNRVRMPFAVNAGAQARRDRRPGRARLGRARRRAQHEIPRLARPRARAGGAEGLAERGQLPAGRFRQDRSRRGGRRLPDGPRHHRAPRRRLRPADLPAPQHRHRRGMRGGRRGAGRLHGGRNGAGLNRHRRPRSRLAAQAHANTPTITIVATALISGVSPDRRRPKISTGNVGS